MVKKASITKALLPVVLTLYTSLSHSQKTIEEVIVTAQRKEESIRDVSIAIQAFTGSKLKDLGISNIEDLSQNVPGFTYANSGFTVPIYTIRGIGFADQSAGANSAVGVYIDQINLPYPVMTKMATLDIQRVEILKGPQGTLYGRNTTGGAINYIPNKPAGEMEWGGSVSYGRFDEKDVEAYLSGPILPSLGGRIAYREVRSDEGWQKSLTRPEDSLGKKKKQAGRLLFDWQTTENISIQTFGQWWKDESDTQAPQAFKLEPVNPNFVDPRVRDHPLVPRNTGDMRVADWPTTDKWRLDEDFLMGGVTLSWLLPKNMILHYAGSYQDFDSNKSGATYSGLSIRHSEALLDFDIEAYSHELRLEGVLFDSVDWMLGVYASDDEVDQTFFFFSETASSGMPNPVIPTGNSVTDTPTTVSNQVSRTRAIFSHNEWQALNYLKITLGARYTEDEKDYAGCMKDSPERRSTGVGLAAAFNAVSLLQGGEGDIPPGGCVTLDDEGNTVGLVERKLKENSLAFRTAIDWTPTESSLYYLSYSRGFKAGSFPNHPTVRERQLQAVSQEQVDAVEIGSKNTFFERRMELNTAAFYYDYKDKQLFSNINDEFFGPLPALANIPNSKVKGAEVEISAIPLDGLNLAFAATYLKTEIDEFVGINQKGNTVDTSGNEFNYTPNWSYSLDVSYRRHIFGEVDFVVGTSANYTGDSKSSLDEDPDFFMDDYTIVNYRVGLKHSDDMFSVLFWGKNVTNEFYVNNVCTCASDTVTRWVGPPQAYGVTISYRH